MSAKRTRAVNAGSTSKSSTVVEVKIDILCSRTRPRSVRKNYYESDNADDFGSDVVEVLQKQKKQSQRAFTKSRSEDTDSFSSEDDEFEPLVKKVKSKKIGRTGTASSAQKTKTKLRIPIKKSNSTRRGKHNNNNNDDDSSEEDEGQGTKTELYINSRSLLLSSEGSDSDVPEVPPTMTFPKADASEKCERHIESHDEGERAQKQKLAELRQEKVVGDFDSGSVKTDKSIQDSKRLVVHEYLLDDVEDVNVNKSDAKTKTKLKGADGENLTYLKTSENIDKTSKVKSSSKNNNNKKKNKKKKESPSSSKSKHSFLSKDGDSDVSEVPKTVFSKPDASEKCERHEYLSDSDVKDVNINKVDAETKPKPITKLKDADRKNLTCLKTSKNVDEISRAKSSLKKKKTELRPASKSKPLLLSEDDESDDNGDEGGGDSENLKKQTKGSKQTNQKKKKAVKKKAVTGVKAGNVTKVVPPRQEEDDIRAMLLQMEGGNQQQTDDNVAGCSVVALEEESSDSAWEEVADDPSSASTSTRRPDEAIEITLEYDQLMKKRKKKKSGAAEWNAFLKRIFNNFQRNLRISTHKVHLLCCICHGMHLNRICNDPTIQALGLSLVARAPGEDKLTLPNIKDIMTSFSKRIEIHSKGNPNDDDGDFCCATVMEAFSLHRASSAKQLVLMVAATLRALGLRIRIVLSFHPVPMKDTKGKIKTKNQTSKKLTSPNRSEKNIKTSEELGEDVKQPKTKKGQTKASKTTKVMKGKQKSELPVESTNLRKCRPSRARHVNICYKDGDSHESSEDETKPEVKKPPAKSELENPRLSSCDFEDDTIEFRSVDEKKKTIAKKTSHKIISNSSSDNSLSTKYDLETWIEVYLEKENRWFPVDCVNLVFNDVSHFEKLSSRPLVYVMAFDNDGSLKDLTARYSSAFLVKTRKLRVDKEWWEDTLKPYLNTSADDVKEDEQIKVQLLDQPLPKTIGEYKSHPLYALRRHLLKFEAIYPNTAVPMGFIRNEPIYARECVAQLHARETWMKDGRCVKVGEEPYKLVKSRPKWNKPKENPDIPDLEVFGFWQTEVYVPPPAVNGKIPRNEYGNVELYKPSMLPAGTVHLTEPGLNRAARKIGIDCAAAMVGWDFHGGVSHPVFDGWVVCVEHKEKVLSVWQKEQQLAKEREIAKREKRIYGNWKKLIRGLRIREALKRKYDLQEPGDVEEFKVEETNDKNTGSAAKSRTAVDDDDDNVEDDDDNDDDNYWPRNRQKSLKRKSATAETKKGEEKPLLSAKKKKTTTTTTTKTRNSKKK